MWTGVSKILKKVYWKEEDEVIWTNLTICCHKVYWKEWCVSCQRCLPYFGVNEFTSCLHKCWSVFLGTIKGIFFYPFETM